MTQEEKNIFIKEYLETNYKGDSYEAYAEKEDLADACNTAIEWADKTMLDKACKWLSDNIWKYYNPNTLSSFEELINDFKQAMEK